MLLLYSIEQGAFLDSPDTIAHYLSNINGLTTFV